ncbi:MAG TPA: TrbI/VirB10 family protein [Novosphingobium sp.]|nr:TrbI/VirB10 family protein [Novosphingobium sp.]
MLPPALPSPAPPAEAARPRGGGAGGAALVVDLTSGAGASTGAAASADAATADDTARATLIRSRATVIPQGAIIAAVLETPLNSDRPGLARAIVGQDVRGFDGARVLIPRGSRLVGEFKAQGGGTVSRVLVSWTRLIRPDGVAIRIASPAADGLGGAGIPGTVNAHFLDKFASAVLQSALTVGVNVASTLASSGASTIYLGLPSQSSQIGQQLVPTANRAATVKVPAGAQIAVLVAHDLDFSGTPAVR